MLQKFFLKKEFDEVENDVSAVRRDAWHGCMSRLLYTSEHSFEKIVCCVLR